jgi:hypothetical protein
LRNIKETYRAERRSTPFEAFNYQITDAFWYSAWYNVCCVIPELGVGIVEKDDHATCTDIEWRRAILQRVVDNLNNA